MDPTQQAKLRQEAKWDQWRQQTMEEIRERLKTESILDGNLVDLLAYCNQPAPRSRGWLWWKKHFCPCCGKKVSLHSRPWMIGFIPGRVTFSACECGWLWAEGVRFLP